MLLRPWWIAPLLVTTLLVPLVAQETPTPPDTAPTKIDGKAKFTPCATCHGHLDPKLSSDRLWIDRVNTTACVQPLGPKSAPTRRAIIEYLAKAEDRPPIESKPRDAKPGEGQVLLAHPENLSVLFVSTDGKRSVRANWTNDASLSLRVLPVGDWRVQRYVIAREDAQGKTWQLWAGGPNGRTIRVDEEKATPLQLDPRVLVTPSVRWSDRGLHVGIAVTGDSQMGVSIIRGDDRVPASYRLLGSDGMAGKGGLEYG